MIQYGRSIRWSNDYEDEVKFSRENGFDFMQIWYLKGELVLDKVSEPKENTIIDYEFPVIIHAVLDINEFEEHVPKIIKILKKLSHTEVIIHPICESEGITKRTIMKLSKKVSEASKLFMKEGITLFVENNSRLDPINYEVNEIKVLYSENEDIELLLDIAHVDNYDHLKEIIKIKKPKMLHIADKRFNVIHEHLPIGEGELDFDYILNNILYDFSGKIILEVVDEDEQIIKSIDKIKKIFEEIA